MARPSPRTVRRLIGLTLLVSWEAVPRLGLLPELFLPPLTKTLAVLWLDRGIYAAA
jgi:NitT/TauT family transport system permease protein/taurine transport system permease protein